MVRAPCCEKMGLKKGPWTPDEDQVLVNYIKLYGHGNWRALPRQAGLMRCGKSCRLRWTNYLRPDIKRGNFTIEEEETIIKLHEMLGNRWSTIAARLPGRTDNEIKNVWHTHLKKRLRQNYANPPEIRSYNNAGDIHAGGGEEEPPRPFKFTSFECMQNTASTSPPHCSSESSSVVTAENAATNVNNRNGDFSRNNLPEADENFWLEVLANDQMAGMGSLPGLGSEAQGQFGSTTMEPVHGMSSHVPETMDFWYNIFTRGGELPELKEIL